MDPLPTIEELLEHPETRAFAFTALGPGGTNVGADFTRTPSEQTYSDALELLAVHMKLVEEKVDAPAEAVLKDAFQVRNETEGAEVPPEARNSISRRPVAQDD